MVEVRNAPVSLVMTVRNEAGSLPALLDSVLEQSLRPAEVVIADGGSTDGTVEMARGYGERLPVRVLELPGANISEGRNAAIRAAECDLVAVTDAGVHLDPMWLERLARPLLKGRADVASGFFVADPRTPFEVAMGATVLPDLADIKVESFLPSSRSVAFRKEAWARVGGYPEWLDYCEDLVFDMRLRESGCNFVFVPEAVAHFRPRSNLRAFFVQYYRYARGDGKAGLWPRRHAVRYLTYSVGPAVAAWGWANRKGLVGRAALALVALGAAGYLRRPYARLLPRLRGLPASSALFAISQVPLIRLTGDVAKMMGYPVGWVGRTRKM
ncbi:MAG: glycosyltransferase [Chloroflexia bacterium]